MQKGLPVKIFPLQNILWALFSSNTFSIFNTDFFAVVKSNVNAL